jgi:hypothetical protein
MKCNEDKKIQLSVTMWWEDGEMKSEKAGEGARDRLGNDTSKEKQCV